MSFGDRNGIKPMFPSEKKGGSVQKHDWLQIDFFRNAYKGSLGGYGDMPESAFFDRYEVPIKPKPFDRPLGFWDNVLYVDLGECWEEAVGYEFKSGIYSIGEFLRQVNTYRSYPIEGHFHKRSIMVKKVFLVYLGSERLECEDFLEHNGVRVIYRVPDPGPLTPQDDQEFMSEMNRITNMLHERGGYKEGDFERELAKKYPEAVSPDIRAELGIPDPYIPKSERYTFNPETLAKDRDGVLGVQVRPWQDKKVI